MHNKLFVLLIVCNLIPISSFCQNNKLKHSRLDQIPQDNLLERNKSYIEGYIQALIDANYHELNVIVYINTDGIAYLFHLPKDARIKSSIIDFVKNLNVVKDVKEAKTPINQEAIIVSKKPYKQINGIWFPESTVIFSPLIANPREPVYSFGYRLGDSVLANRQATISLGDIFPIFRYFDIFDTNGDMQIEIAGSVWANFDNTKNVTDQGDWAEFITSDYLISLPLTFALENICLRLRVYHISSHLGDEYMISHPEVERINPSFEALDFISSYQYTSSIRWYLGPGFVLHSDPSQDMSIFYLQYGIEIRFPYFYHAFHKLHGTPFVAMDIQHWQTNNFLPNTSLQIGYEWSKLPYAGRKARLFAEYYNGNSEGQFLPQRTSFYAIRLSWGY